jgi:hypothetical protein
LFQTSIFFGACFTYKLVYYNLYHVSDFTRNHPILRKTECIEFVCNKLVLVLVQIDLIQFENSNCIRSICTKTNTNPLHTNSIHSGLHKIGHVIQIVVHQFVHKMSAEKNPKSVKNWFPFITRNAGILRISTKEKKNDPL